MKALSSTFFALLATLVSAAAAPPANDGFSAASVLTDSAVGTTVEATAEPGEPNHTGHAALHSVWWTYTPAATGPVEIETFGSSFDTRLSVYTGSSLATLVLVAENDDHNSEVTQSRLVLSATAGTVYRIAVDGFSGATGGVQLRAFSSTPPANDLFANAADLGAVAHAEATVDNRGASAEANEPPHAGHPADVSVWWKWTAPFTGDVQIDTFDSHVDTLLGVYTGNSLATLALVAESDDAVGHDGGQSAVVFHATTGVTYSIAVDAYHGAEGDITVKVDEVLPHPASNDDFANATVLASGRSTSVTGSNFDGSVEADEPFHAGQHSEATSWWSWTPLASGPVTISTVGSAFDTVLGVYAGSAVGALTEVAANDDADGSTSRSIVVFNAVAGTTYRIAVGGFESASGDIALSVLQVPDAAANDAFAAATDLGSAGSVSATGVSSGATPEAGEPPHGDVAARRSIWWKWTCGSDEYVHLTTAGSSFDTLLAVYTGASLTGLSPVVANDDADPLAAVPVLTSSVDFFATTGTTYFFAVQGKADAEGLVSLHLDPVPPPANDPFAAAIVIPGASYDVTDHNYDATAEVGEPAHAGQAAAHSLWWQWTAPSDGLVFIRTQGSSIDTRVAVYLGGSLGSLSLVMANDNEAEESQSWSLVRFRAHAGVTYRIALDGAAGEQGFFHLTLNEEPLAVDNDAFATATDLGSSGTVHALGTNLGASAEAGEPAHRGTAAEGSVWWKWTAPTTGWAQVTASESHQATRLAVYTGSSVSQLAVAENVSDTPADTESCKFHTVAGTVCFIAVDGVAGHEGDIVLDLTPSTAPAAPGNDSFAQRMVIDAPTPIDVVAPSNLYATAESGEPAHAGAAAAHSVWFQWTPQVSGRIALDASATTFPRRIAIYTGASLAGLVPVAAQGTGTVTPLELNVTAQTTYQIAIDDSGVFGAGGVVAFTVDYLTPPNDDFANATDLGSAFPTTAQSYNSHATAESGEPAHAGLPAVDSIWWKWTAAVGGVVTIETSGAVDTSLSVYEGSTLGNLTVVAENDDASAEIHTSLVTFAAQAGHTYRIAVDGFQGSAGFIGLAIHPGNLPAAPLNDNFSAATDLGTDHPVTVSGSNDHATADAGEPSHAGNAPVDSVWWKWTAPVDTTVSIDTFGSAEDTVLAVYTGNAVGALTLVASNDDASGGVTQSAVTFSATAGTTYRIAVDGFHGITGDIVVNLSISGPANDQFAHRMSLGSATTVTLAATNAGATSEPSEPSHLGVAAAHTVWWTWTAPVNMTVDLHTYGSEADTLLVVYTGSSLGTLVSVAGNDDLSPTDHNSRVVFNAIAGTAYQIVVGSAASGDMTDFDISLSPTAAADPPANDAFAAAIDLGGGYAVNTEGTTLHGTAEAGEPNHVGTAAHDSIWWKWTAPFDGTLSVDTLASDIDTKLAVYTGNVLATLTEVAANDDASATVTQSSLSLAVTRGTIYRIVIDGFGGVEGDVNLHLAFVPSGSGATLAYRSWAGAMLPDGTLATQFAADADPDGDGIANGIEYLMGLSPAAGNGSMLAVSRTALATVLTYPRGAGVPAGLEVIEGSTALGTWTVLSSGQFSRTVVPGGSGQPDSVSVVIPHTSGFKFFRLRVTLTP